MKINPQNIATILQDVGLRPEDQGRYLNAAAAKVIAYRLPIPVAPVTDREAYFREHLEGMVAGALDAIVERVPIDVDATLKTTYQLWDNRYMLVYCPTGRAGWTMIDQCVKLGGVVSSDVDFTSPALQLLCTALDNGVED